jgi:uncharacterized protein (TIGR03086 family)
MMDLLDLFERGTAWTASKIPAAARNLDASTPCDEWNVRALINHMLQAQQLFTGAARGEPAAPPSGAPLQLMGDDPVAQYEKARQTTLQAYREPGAIEKTGPTLGIAFVEQLVHGWDLAKATGQDATMPDDLAQAAFEMIDGRMTDEQRGRFFKPAVPVPRDARAQDKLLGYGGRQP